MMINKDKPIESIEQDILHREKFVNSVVTLLKNNDDAESLVIGLFGPWGSGKTSIINMICYKLNQEGGAKDRVALSDGQNNSEGIIAIRFNPWLYSNTHDLVNQFFSFLIDELQCNKSQSSFSKVIEVLSQYKSAIAPLTSLGINPVAGAVINSLIEFVSEASGMIVGK